MIDMIEQHLLGLAEIAGNRVLALDDNALEHCRDLQGCIVSIELTDLDKVLYCHPGSWGIRFSQQKPSRDPDSRIRGRLMALINLTLQKDKLSTSIQERVEIIGNASVAQKFQKLFSEMDIDWEEQLSQVTGDITAYRVFQGMIKARQWLQGSFGSLSGSTREYLQEESQHLPTQVEFDTFSEQVTQTRYDVERLEARLAQLEKSVK
jgi:ubiquinone biosynthesis protein UbiJ